MRAAFKIDRIAIKNFRSVLDCDVSLDQLTILVGKNEAGKTSIVDALSFVADSLRHSVGKAIRDRTGINTILHVPAQFPAAMAFCFDISSSAGLNCRYSLEIMVEGSGSVSLSREECWVKDADDQEHYYRVRDGSVEGSARVLPTVSRDRLFLVNASGLAEFRVIYDFLATIQTEEFRGKIGSDSDNDLIMRFRNLIRDHPDQATVVQDYLRAISPSFDHLEAIEVNNKWFLQFFGRSTTTSHFAFGLSQVSAGLLSSASILLDLFEPPEEGKPASMVILEEPEAFLHPSAVAVLRDSFLEASASRQVLVTSHSVDLLDDRSIPEQSIRIVYRDGGGTQARPLDDATVSILRDQLFTAGELLRQGALVPHL